ncbi:MAG TPA: hypothetical protein VL309_08740 [Vicinamibacterales bacterium]|jgi:hypothetical protein|nr:hypothetical protein [Vicinamibacterales bacterium]
MTVLETAERIAREAHAGQKETLTGDDYIRHIERVVAMVDGEDAKLVAWLHDVVEDNPAWTFDRLAAAGVPARLIRPITLLTRRPPFSYVDYVETIATSGDPLAVAVKIADLHDHLRPNCPISLRLRYEKALARLAGGGTAAIPGV